MNFQTLKLMSRTCEERLSANGDRRIYSQTAAGQDTLENKLTDWACAPLSHRFFSKKSYRLQNSTAVNVRTQLIGKYDANVDVYTLQGCTHTIKLKTIKCIYLMFSYILKLLTLGKKPVTEQ